LEALKRQPRLSDKVAQQILERIVSQRLRPGAALPPERELGEQFGVSRTVVREAIRALDARGLLEVRVGSRIKVAAVDATTVNDAIVHFVRSREEDGRAVAEISAALDVAVAALAAERATEDDRQRIATALERVERGEDRPGGLAAAESAFRHAVIASTHNDLVGVLAETMARLRPSAVPTRTHEPGASWHRALATAIFRGHAEEARRAVIGHLA
jgi:GntR family transcriptional repressor for pyruvate dehydrogenase complex